MPAIRFTITFTGRVQGVGFRATTVQIARRFDVAGWVRNEPDSSVQCVAEGERSKVEAFVRAIQDEMDGYLSNTQIEECETLRDLRGFTIRFEGD